MSSNSYPKAPDGLLVVDKPQGPTSHDVVSRMRRTLGVRAIGHAGTLDPMATGVLVLAIGEATKLTAWLTSHEKSYDATIALGHGTDTLDSDGLEIARAPLGPKLEEALERSGPSHLEPILLEAIERERARTMQVPPQFSAIRVRGRRAFALARSGQRTSLPARPVAVRRLDLVGCTSSGDRSARTPSLEISIAASKGYYVRALARDLADALGTYGHLTRLRRTRSGPFTLQEAVLADADRDAALAHIQPIATVVTRVLRIARLNEAGASDARHGRSVRASDIVAEAPGPCAWLDERGEMVAVGEIGADGCGRVLRGFADRSSTSGPISF